jgi:hypothetical protein
MGLAVNNSVGSLPLVPRYAVLGDGNTEKHYIHLMCRYERITNVVALPKLPRNQPQTISALYQWIQNNSRGYTNFFWIIDLDAIFKETKEQEKKSTLESFQSVYVNLGKHPTIIPIINHPCLEYWFLLHFQLPSKHFDCYDSSIGQKMDSELLQYMPNYIKAKKRYYKFKNKEDIYTALKPYLSNARKRSKSISFDLNNPFQNLSEMYKIFDELKIP